MPQNKIGAHLFLGEAGRFGMRTIKNPLGMSGAMTNLGTVAGCDYREFRPYINQHPYGTLIADLVDHTGFVVGKHIGV